MVRGHGEVDARHAVQERVRRDPQKVEVTHLGGGGWGWGGGGGGGGSWGEGGGGRSRF